MFSYLQIQGSPCENKKMSTPVPFLAQVYQVTKTIGNGKWMLLNKLVLLMLNDLFFLSFPFWRMLLLPNDLAHLLQTLVFHQDEYWCNLRKSKFHFEECMFCVLHAQVCVCVCVCMCVCVFVCVCVVHVCFLSVCVCVVHACLCLCVCACVDFTS